MSLAMNNEKLNSVTVARGHLEQEDKLSHGQCMAFFLLSCFPQGLPASPALAPLHSEEHSIATAYMQIEILQGLSFLYQENTSTFRVPYML